MHIGFVPEEIEGYATAYSTVESPVLRKLREETYTATEAPYMLVGPLEAAMLKFLVKVSGAKRVLEVGTFTGYSALAMSEALPENGELITLEIDEVAASIAKRFFAKSPHGRKISVILGPALQTIPELKGLFDLVFIDADKENYSNYWNLCTPKIKSGGLMVVDNVLWSLGDVIHPKTSTDKAIAAFNEMAHKDPQFETVVFTIRDGVLIALKC